MPQGKMIQFEAGEYPQLDGLEVGAKVKFSGIGTIQEGGMAIDSIDVEAEGMADRELKTMTKNNTVQAGAGGKSLADQF